ncbi:tRNA(m(1)G37)methyltransferase [Tulasnella sp. JGI-2019a]|nr:tRNA(m(1)G37)methyltransferase [Tulasnella sp. JGI-2019a]
MSSTLLFDLTPPVHRGMMALDRDKFQKSLKVLAARIPAALTGSIKGAVALKREILDLPKIRSVEPDPNDSASRLLLLARAPEDAMPPSLTEFLTGNSTGLTTFDIHLNYDYWNADDILQAILPEDLIKDGIPSSFTNTGHIGHFNLRDEYLPYKHLIGQIILDKHKNLRTVVNKVDTIDTQFRVFKMEVIAGGEDFNVVLNESGCTFAFDFSKVYWNSRLQGEHDRIITLFQPGEVIVDVFAGVGPFALPAAKKGCYVLGNDLNPSSSEAMQANVERNKVQPWIRVSCEDGREFIRGSTSQIWREPFQHTDSPRSLKQKQKAARRARETGVGPLSEDLQHRPQPRRRIDHFVMNLPATAIEFLGAFRGVFKPLHDADPKEFDAVYGDVMPMVHCHCFTKELEGPGAEEDLRKRVAAHMGAELPTDAIFHFVRRVAPNKDMYCISFRLPRDVGLC